MKIVVFGASGKTGSLLVDEALTSGHDVIAYVRKPESVKSDHPNIKVVAGYLNEKDKLKSVISGSDGCISTLGGASLTKHSREIIEGIDNIVTIMEEEKVMRFIYLSSFGAGDSRKYMPQPARFFIADLLLHVPLADHNTNENRIKKSQLNWTIVRPGGLTNGAKTDNLKHGCEMTKIKGSSSISRANLAAFLLDQVSNNDYANKSVWLHE
ncbi:MAG: NAD(P)H-binding protein [Bacteroidales bacterium]|nr:NAD(P)H-binding protein [Bacteroidales bacterium]